MTDDDGIWYLDLLLAAGAAGFAVGAVRGGLDGPLRVALVAPLVLVVPGYALLSCLFPESGSPAAALDPFDEPVRPGQEAADAGGLDGLVRLVLSVVLSAVVVPLAVLAADVSTYGITERGILLSVGGATALLLVVAAVRRLLVEPERRFAVDPAVFAVPLYSRRGHRIDSSPLETTVPNIVLVVGVLVLVSSVGYAATTTQHSPEYTEFRVGTENMTIDSESLYDDRLPRGQSSTVETVVTNREGERTEYTVVAVLQSVQRGDDGVSVRESAVVGATDVTLRDGEQRRVPLEVTPSMGGDDHRLLLLLYRDGAPSAPTAETAYRTLRLSVALGGDGGGSAALAGDPGGATGVAPAEPTPVVPTGPD